MCTCQQQVTMGHPLCIYFWPAAGPSSLSWCVCVCVCVSERASVKGDVGRGGYAHFCAVFSQPLQDFATCSVAAVTEDVPVNLDPHVPSPPHCRSGRGSRRCGIWKFLPSSKYTDAPPGESRYVWLSAPRQGGDCFRREIATSDRRAGGRGAGRERGRRSAPATPLLCLYHRCHSDELCMRPIDRLARLCSTDPLWRAFPCVFFDIKPK